MRPVGGPDLDRRLVRSFQQGDAGAYDQIYERYHERVHSVCLRMLGRPSEAEEAAQEAFLRAYQALGRFNGSYYLGAWLTRIATNVCLDLLRSRSRATLVALPDGLEDLETEPSPEEVVVGDHPRLEAAIGSIQPLHASALRLRAVQGLSHQEMAHHLAMTPAQVKALLHRARSSLRRAWDRVEGMALVPVLYLRHLFGDRDGQTGTGMAGVVPAVAPGLAEKVAASAVVVVTALVGATGTGYAPLSPAPIAPGGIAVTKDPRALDGLSAERLVAPSSDALVPEEASAGEADLLAKLPVEVPVELPKQRDEEPPSEEEEPAEDNDPPAHQAEGVAQEVRRVVHEITETPTDS